VIAATEISSDDIEAVERFVLRHQTIAGILEPREEQAVVERKGETWFSQWREYEAGLTERQRLEERTRKSVSISGRAGRSLDQQGIAEIARHIPSDALNTHNISPTSILTGAILRSSLHAIISKERNTRPCFRVLRAGFCVLVCALDCSILRRC
jgi:hypothetical protein